MTVAYRSIIKKAIITKLPTGKGQMVTQDSDGQTAELNDILIRLQGIRIKYSRNRNRWRDIVEVCEDPA